MPIERRLQSDHFLAGRIVGFEAVGAQPPVGRAGYHALHGLLRQRRQDLQTVPLDDLLPRRHLLLLCPLYFLISTESAWRGLSTPWRPRRCPGADRAPFSPTSGWRCKPPRRSAAPWPGARCW